MIVLPNVRTLYQIAGGNTTVVKVIIAGGIPMPQVSHSKNGKDCNTLIMPQLWILYCLIQARLVASLKMLYIRENLATYCQNVMKTHIL